MIVYFGVLFSIIVLLLLPTEKTVFNHKAKLKIAFLLLFVYAAIRVDYGSDYEFYKLFFEGRGFGTIYSTVNAWEIGFSKLCTVLPNYRTLIILTSFLICFSYYKLFDKYIQKKHHILAFVLLFLITNSFIGQLTGMRIAIAINCLMLSIPLLVKRKMFWFIALMFIASFFHQSALMMIPVYFVASSNKLTQQKFVLLAFLMLSYWLLSQFYIRNLTNKFVDQFFVKYSIYMEYEAVESSNVLGQFVFSLYIFCMSIVLLFIMTKKHSKENMVILKLMMFFYIVYFIGNIGLSSRIYFYFAPFYIAGTSIVISNLKNSIYKYGYLLGVFLYFGYLFVKWVQDPRVIDNFYIYKSIFS